MKKHTGKMAMIALAALLLMILSGCSSAQDSTTVAAEPEVLTAVPVSEAETEVPIAVPVIEAEPEGLPDVTNETRRQDGERFEGVIMLEGMQETVKYEHVRNDSLGIELDYDYENFERHNDSGSERFVSRYDAGTSLDIGYSPESAEKMEDSFAETFSMAYDIVREPCTLAKAGSCIRIDASATKDGQTPDLLQAVYIIPAGEGSIVAGMQYSFEAADGFGKRFNEILNTLEVIGRNN